MTTEEESAVAPPVADASAPDAVGAEAAATAGSAPGPQALASRPKDVKIPLPASLQEIVGALLFASPQPLTATDLRECVRRVEPDEGDDPDVFRTFGTCTNREINEALRGLEKELERAGIGFRLVNAGGAYRMQTASSCGRYVRALLKIDRPNRLTRAALETLAIIAYRQPVTKTEVEQIRGVAVDSMVKTLMELNLIRLVGKSELPGHPFLYGTTPLFLEHFSLASLDELNAIDPTLPRSDPRARAKLFKKEEKSGPTELERAAQEMKAARDGENGKPGDDDDFFIDDTPDEFDDEDDEDDDGDEDGEEEGADDEDGM